VLLLVSADFIASDACVDVETQRALARHARGEAVVIPIIVRPTDWETTPLHGLTALPADAKPVTSLPDPDDAWLDVVRGLRVEIAKLVAARAATG
jgi:hypothetical protein